MMKPIGVDCTFAANGTVRVRRILVDEKWIPVGQGRQWVDGDGRHLLIMLPGSQVRQIRLRADTLTWEMTAVAGSGRPRIA